jgi:GT2 family glycosyltransferase
MDKIATIIVHYNTEVDTKETLDSLSLIETEGIEHQVFLVDNASREPLALSKNRKGVNLIRSDTNLGFTGGNNLGFAAASKTFNPDYFLLLNSDTTVKPDFLLRLYERIKVNPDLGLVSPKIYFYPHCEFHRNDYKKSELGKVLWYAGGVIDWRNLQAFHAGVDELDRGQFDSGNAPMDYATGCCFLVRREVLATTGVFDDQYFLYLEDVDLSYRIKRAGFRLEMEPQAVIWHKNGGSTQGSGSDLQTYYQTRNRLLFFMTYGKWQVQQRVWRLAWRLWRHGSRVEKLAAKDFFTRTFGKRVAI